MFAVADGMGGAQAGEVASRTAAEVFETTEPPDGHARGAAHEPGAGGQPAHLRAGPERRVAQGHGHHPHRGDARRRRRERGACGRQPRLPAARRQARAAHPRPLAGGRARAQRPDRAGRGGAPSAALDHHARAGPRGRCGGGRAHPRGAGRRHLPDLLRRPDEHDLRRRGGRAAARLRRPRRPRPRPWSGPRTRAEARTTSPWSCSAWTTTGPSRATARASGRRAGHARPEATRSTRGSPPATSRAAVAERDAEATERAAGARHAAAERPAGGAAAPPRRGRRRAVAGLVAGRRARGRGRGPVARRAPGLLPGHERQRAGHALPRGALRGPFRPRAVLRRGHQQRAGADDPGRAARAPARSRVAQPRGWAGPRPPARGRHAGHGRPP